MRAKLIAVLGGALSLGAAGAASAADMAVKARPVVAPVVAYDWTGFYGSVGVGYGWGEVRAAYVLPPPDRHDSNKDGGWWDGRLGFQYMFSNRIVLGVEGAWAGPFDNGFGRSLSPTGSCLLSTADSFCDGRIRDIGSVGGKLGYGWDKFMLYGQAGWATTEIETRTGIASTGLVTRWEANRYRHDGWYAGVGGDYVVGRIFANTDVILGVDYRHYEFNTVRHFPSPVGTPAPAVVDINTRDVKGSLDVVMARLTFKWNPQSPVVAKY